MRQLAAWAFLLAAAVGVTQDLPTTAPDATTEPTTAPATAPAPPRTVAWHRTYAEAADDARRRGTPLVAVYLDTDAPASEALAELTLADAGIAELLADFAAVKLDAAAGEGKALLAKARAGEAPVTQVLSPGGELLDSLPGFVTAKTLRGRLEDALAWQRAVSATPFDPAARWRAVQARLGLSTRAEAVKDIDALLKRPAGQLPQGADHPRLRLARGEALSAADPARAQEDLQEALRLRAADEAVGGRALLELADLWFRTARPKQAVEACARYVEQFPDGPEAGRAWYTKAKVELLGVADPAKAAGTIEQFLRKRPDDLWAVRAQALLEQAREQLPASRPATRPAKEAAPETKPAKGKVPTYERVSNGE